MQHQETPGGRMLEEMSRTPGVAVFRLDAQGRIVEFSPQAQALFGYAPEEVVGRPAALLAENDQDARLETLVRRSRELGRVQHAHLDVRTEDGRAVFVCATVAWAPENDTAVALVADISPEREDYEKLKRNTLEVIRLNVEIRRQSAARQAALDALEELSARLQGVLAAASQVVIVATGPTGTVTVFNSGARNLLGYGEDEMVGVATPLAFLDREELAARGLALAVEGETPPQGLAVLAGLAASDRAAPGEWTLVRKNGTRFPAEVALSPILGPEGVEGYLLVGVDISARRQAEQALRRHAATLEEQRRAMENDLRAAADIQRSLLPDRLPLDPRYRAGWLFEPSATIGGDIFNIRAQDDHHLVVYMLDVSGHGVSSALVASAAAQALQSLSQTACRGAQPPQPEAVLTALDKEFPLERFDRYFSLVYLVLDLRDGRFTYCNAGHPPPLLVHPGGGMDLLDVGGTVVGLGDIMPFERGRGELGPGDMLVFYTDGVTEFENALGESFGAARLRACCTAAVDRSPEALMTALAEERKRFGRGAAPQDDVSVLAIERRAAD